MQAVKLVIICFFSNNKKSNRKIVKSNVIKAQVYNLPFKQIYSCKKLSMRFLCFVSQSIKERTDNVKR